jgi:hypothetical protein
MAPADRRRAQRYAVKTPLGARVGAINAVVMDASEKGISLSHEGKIPNAGTTCRVIMQSAMGPITVDCEVVHTRHHEPERPAEGRNGFLSGLRVVAADFQSEQRFRQLLRSLMGQRTNGS